MGGRGDMEHFFCSECGCGITQGLKRYRNYFRAVFPTTFHIEDGAEPVPSCLLPDMYRPKCHVHYENRLIDWQDDLPKFKGSIQEKTQMANDGSIVQSQL